MSRLLRNRLMATKPETPKLIELNEILKIVDKNEKQNAFNVLINHLLKSDICITIKCHDWSQILTQLTDNLVYLQNCDQQLDRVINNFNLIDLNDKQIIDKYFQLIYELINLKPFKCNQILENIIFTKFIGFKQFINESQIQSQELEIFDKIHSFLSRIKISKFESNLLRSFERKFPFISGPMVFNHSFVCYVYNIFKAYDYISNKSKLMSITFEKLLEIDLIVANESNTTYEEVFNIEDLNQSKTEPIVNKKVEIYDNLMLLLIEFLENKIKNNSKEENEEFFNLFKNLFSSVILSVETSNHLSYIWLYLCSLSNPFFEEFVEYLWNFGLNNENSLQNREKSLYFIGSLLKTANFIPISVVINFMNMCSLWIHDFIDKNDGIPDRLTEEETMFYILCQLLFDIFCAIHSDLDTLSLRRIKVMNFQRIIRCKLNPLEFCSRDVETQFLSLARHYQIGYCPQSDSSNDNRLKAPTDQLNFVYILPKSHNKIEKLCKHLMNLENSVVTGIERFNSFKSSDESDNIIGSYKMSYSPSKTLWQNLLSDSSPNERMEFD